MPVGTNPKIETKVKEIYTDPPKTTSGTAPATIKVEKSDMIEVKKTTLDEVLRRLERAEYALNKGRLASYDSMHADKSGKTVRLRTLDGKVVLSWDNLVKNLVEKNERGVWMEDQIVKLNFEDGSSSEMPYIFFSRRHEYLIADVVRESKNFDEKEILRDGDTLFTVKDRVSGQKYKIGSKFIN